MEATTRAQAALNLIFIGLLASATWLGLRPAGARDDGQELRFGFRFEEVAERSGIAFHHEAPLLDPKLDRIMPHVAGLGAAVSIADANGDGWADVYATSSAFGRPNGLFLNQRDGTFRDVAREMGLADLNRAGEGVSMGSVWGDYDRDGDADVFVHKYGFQQLLRNDGPAFTDVTEAAGLRRWMNSNAATWIDYDRDGLLDLYVAGYFREDVDLWSLATTRIMQDSFEFARNGGHNYLFRNLGDGRFADVTERTGADSTRWTLAVSAADLDGDGWQDLYLANDYGPEELFLNRGGETFERASAVGLDESSKAGMCVAFGDILNEGRLAVFVTNISKSGFLFQGNNLRINRLADKGRMFNVADGEPAVADCGWAWGARFGDFDNDGDQDLFVLNGFVSASETRDYWYRMAEIAGGVGDLFEDARNWPPFEDRSLSGYERSRVLLNNGGRGFTDVAQAVGVGDRLDGRAVALADLFNRGALDAVVANQRGPLLVYRNRVDPARSWIQFRLTGARSNPSAIGAEVTVTFGGRTLVQVVGGGGGFCSQDELRLHFGLGAAEEVERAVIRWPSGCTQTLEHVAARQVVAVREDC